MDGIHLDRLEQLAEGLALAFYVLMFTAFITALAGSTGSGFLVLILGACAHVGRAAIEEFTGNRRVAAS
jgi:hypothetical protein